MFIQARSLRNNCLSQQPSRTAQNCQQSKVYPITLSCGEAESLGKGKPGQAPSDRRAAFDLTMPGDWESCRTLQSAHQTET